MLCSHGHFDNRQKSQRPSQQRTQPDRANKRGARRAPRVANAPPRFGHAESWQSLSDALGLRRQPPLDDLNVDRERIRRAAAARLR